MMNRYTSAMARNQANRIRVGTNDEIMVSQMEACPAKPHLFENFIVSYRKRNNWADMGEFMGFIGRIGHTRAWEYWTGYPGTSAQGVARSKEEAAKALYQELVKG